MLENKENTTLAHSGARVLSAAEYELVTGGFIIRTGPCKITLKPDGTCTFSGDCEPPPAC